MRLKPSTANVPPRALVIQRRRPNTFRLAFAVGPRTFAIIRATLSFLLATGYLTKAPVATLCAVGNLANLGIGARLDFARGPPTVPTPGARPAASLCVDYFFACRRASAPRGPTPPRPRLPSVSRVRGHETRPQLARRPVAWDAWITAHFCVLAQRAT